MGKKSKLKKALLPTPTTSPPADGQDDEQLMDDLLQLIDSRNEPEAVKQESAAVLNEMQTTQQVSSKQDAKSRFKARKARKAAALAENYAQGDPEAEARLAKEAKDEERDISRVCEELHLQMHEINPDGHCLFSAVADQLQLLSILPASEASYTNIRAAASTFIHTHPDDFLPFLTSADEAGSGLMSPEEFDGYCVTIRDTAAWGGEPEIQALSRAFNVPIHVVQGGQPPVVVHDPSHPPPEDTKRVVRISYHRRMYGLGEHYNSLRPKSTRAQISNALKGIL
ncbi:hypothetical protein FB45DRAFT_1026726 [Roridomyces roridus]|uniref:OTU domain-containing protein n=1 Tax=Roridomyces roridus TaxID=1738132 RepID=A0AAD7FPW8_9AGAR|nr:hypothetical protein FB45DRAFT_1026726 [Roridomyces roridus]